MKVHSTSVARALVCAASLLLASFAWSDDEQEFKAKGSGTYLLTTGGGTEIPIEFAFHVKQDDDEAEGRFRQKLELQDLPVEFHGKVTCLAVDPANGRVWVGGVVTRNLSVHPAFTTEIHEPGKDVWFRVLDTGKHSQDPDRSTFLGFEGAGGIITSAEYCDAQIWPDDNDRTHPVIRGKIKLKLDDD